MIIMYILFLMVSLNNDNLKSIDIQSLKQKTDISAYHELFLLKFLATDRELWRPCIYNCKLSAESCTSKFSGTETISDHLNLLNKT